MGCGYVHVSNKAAKDILIQRTVDDAKPGIIATARYCTSVVCDTYLAEVTYGANHCRHLDT